MRRKKTLLKRPVSRSYPVRSRRRKRRWRSLVPARFYAKDKTQMQAAVGGVVIVTLLIGGVSLALNRHAQNSQQFIPVEKASTQFTPLTSQDSNQNETEYRFDEERNVLSFNTAYNGTTITVSQQSAPEDFDDQALADLALQLNAESSIDSDNGPLYIASDSEGDGQTALFRSSETLVFVRANNELSAQDWADYINQLAPR